MDLKLPLNEKVVFIEFDGAAYFAMSQYGSPRKHPFYKKNCIEEKTGIEIVNWHYWIQRCQSNVKSVFEKNIKGYGALWSTKTPFSEFIFEDSANVIEKMNDRFNAQRESGVGYFYVNSENRNNPDHPIIKKSKIKKKI
ncbi:MAG: hypothetical protein ACOC5T_10055 [Elusimicrobiota bacterium]